MYAGVPTMAPVRVSFASSAAATPKSTSLTRNESPPAGELPTRSTFDGFTSRCTIPAACAAASASATSAATSTDCDEGQARPALALRDVLALEPLHRDVRLAVVELTERDDLHDARVAQPREHAPLAPEPRLLACVDPRQRDDLERDRLAR